MVLRAMVAEVLRDYFLDAAPPGQTATDRILALLERPEVIEAMARGIDPRAFVEPIQRSRQTSARGRARSAIRAVTR